MHPEPFGKATLATSAHELEAILSRLVTIDSMRRGGHFHPRLSDILIATYPKSGTTWLQQIAHGLRANGSMDFDEICTVTPWIEIAYDVGWNLDDDQVAPPRVYKTHYSWYEVPKGARYLCAFRDPASVLVSLYRFLEGWLFEPGSISLEEFVQSHWPKEKASRNGYWFHVGSWWKQRDNPDILMLCYEDMILDADQTVGRIARFMGLQPSSSLLERVVHQSSKPYMLAHKDQFDERHLRRACEERLHVSTGAESYKITSGTSDEARYHVSDALIHELNEMWIEQFGDRYGLEDYSALRAAVSERNR